MSIRRYDKDHLREHACVELATQESIFPPEPEDMLCFWTLHETENALVDLRVFARGEFGESGIRATHFSGRPLLITQLVPAIRAHLLGMRRANVHTCTDSLKVWWSILDAVEAAAASTGQHMDRVRDVRQLTEAHYLMAHQRRGIGQTRFTKFLLFANLTLAKLGARQLYWDSPESPSPLRRLPPDEHVKALRIGLKREWQKTLRRWELADGWRSGAIAPSGPEEVRLFKHYCHFDAIREKLGKVLPSQKELAGGDQNFTRKTKLLCNVMKNGLFPDRWDADAAFHQCLSATGWNPCTLYGLDATKNILHTHPKNPDQFLLNGETYELAGAKPRAGGREQIVIGLWKTTVGAGYIIRKMLERTAPLRALLLQELSVERARYAEMNDSGAGRAVLNAQFVRIQKLKAGCLSVWLYADQFACINWLKDKNVVSYSVKGRVKATYLSMLTLKINAQRADRGVPPIEGLTPSDFRDAFATYVYRQSGGNILAVMRLLNHASVRSSQLYVDNNILNAENNATYLKFVNTLFGELEQGRIDLTILAHLVRHGEVTPEMLERLDEYRRLQKSRIMVACKDPRNPPPNIDRGADGRKLCGPQRCLLCKENAIFLPESLDGIAMRVEELLALQRVLPMETWFKSHFPEELKNGMAILRLWDATPVAQARAKWADAIAAGGHYVPGLSTMNDALET
jgi:hypothetical protein